MPAPVPVAVSLGWVAARLLVDLFQMYKDGAITDEQFFELEKEVMEGQKLAKLGEVLGIDGQ